MKEYNYSYNDDTRELTIYEDNCVLATISDAGTYKDGNWEDLLKIDGKYYKITDETVKNA